MKLIIGNRQSGKTTEAIRIANEREARLVVRTHMEAKRIMKEHKPKHPACTIDDLLRGEMLRGTNAPLVIDGVEDLIRRICPLLAIEAITLDASDGVDIKFFNPTSEWIK